MYTCTGSPPTLQRRRRHHRRPSSALIAGPPQGPDMQYLPTSVRRPSVVCCPFRGHIWKTVQDRPIVTMEHY